jgi:hypothetical protein
MKYTETEKKIIETYERRIQSTEESIKWREKGVRSLVWKLLIAWITLTILEIIL